MAYNKFRRGFTTAGGISKQREEEIGLAEPKLNKDPFYRTMDIFNGIFKKQIKLDKGDKYCTDGKTIWVRFAERYYKPIVSARPGKDTDHSVYTLECGHDWEAKTGKKTDGTNQGICWPCGSAQSFLSFEHEWQHIIFKSDLAARSLFVDQYAQALHAQAPHVELQEIKEFLDLFINAFDDIRCNSLWEKVYPGSGANIWARWKRLTEEMGDRVNDEFLCYLFAVAFGVPTDPQGEFEAMRPIIEWGMKKVRGRGFANMLIDVKLVLDRCMGALLAKVPPPPPKPPQQQPQQQAPQAQQQQSQQQNAGQGGQGSDGEDDDTQSSSGGGVQAQQGGQGSQGVGGSEPEDGEENDGAGQKDSAPPPTNIPSAQHTQATPEERSDALKKLARGATPLDENEKHHEGDVNQTQASGATRAAVAKALTFDPKDIDQFDQDDAEDVDMQGALEQLKTGISDKSPDSQLVANAKGKVVIIPVRPEKMTKAPELSSEEKLAVQKMRAQFFKTMGREKAKRGAQGLVVDTQAAIQYLTDRQDPDIFELDSTQQGFSYRVLSDMSGSMSHTFPLVCRGIEMLKQSLDFPFVKGTLWGFRGGGSAVGRNFTRNADTGEVWLYRFDKSCKGYTGMTNFTFPNMHIELEVPVRCDGSTPMHTAVRVLIQELRTQESPGMAKRLFLLTDGSPYSQNMRGGTTPDFILRQYIAKEIAAARSAGVQVYTIVIGEHAIPDDQCRQMFGPQKFWKKVRGDQVFKALTDIVIENFTRFIKLRG